MHSIVYANAGDFFKVQTKTIGTFVCPSLPPPPPPPVAILIYNRFECVISEMNENKFVIELYYIIFE